MTVKTSGLVLGKFMPPHLGHVRLIEFARRYVDDLTVVLGTLSSEPISGTLRFEWMQTLFPTLRVLHLTDENPQDPSEHPDFWRIWRESLQRILPVPPDYVFASEDYGFRLAEELGARFIPFDLKRHQIPVSGTAIRQDPLRYWEFIPACVRPYYVKRVCVFGPESSGKTTLAAALAKQLGTVWVPEYARSYLEAQAGRLCAQDMLLIAKGQCALEDTLSLDANRVLICDTDVLLTSIFSEVLFHETAEQITKLATHRHYDLYLVTDIDVPWQPDPVRYLPDQRDVFLEHCLQKLKSLGRPYVLVSGTLEQRIKQSLDVISTLIQ